MTESDSAISEPAVTADLAVSAVLMPDEAVQWSATAEYGLGRKAAPLGMMTLGVGLFGAGIWSIVENVPNWSAFWSASPDVAGIASTAGIFVIGAMVIWVAKNKHAYIPQPEYRLTQDRTIIVEMRRSGHIETTARFIEPGRALQSVRHGQAFALHIPVRPEAGENAAFVRFERLSKVSHDSAITIVNRILRG